MIWINLGRLLMVGIWGVLFYNLIFPFPKPLTYFFNVALIFMSLTHGLQVLLLRLSLTKADDKINAYRQWRIFFFGSFEFLASQKQGKEK